PTCAPASRASASRPWTATCTRADTGRRMVGGTSGDRERETRLDLHHAALRDGALRGDHGLRRHEKAFAVVRGPGRAAELRDHGLQQRALAGVGLELAHAAAAAAAQHKAPESGDLRRSSTAQDVDGFPFPALLAPANVVHPPKTAVGEAHCDGPALLLARGIRDGEG